jgi:hypothetical protein
LTPAIFGLRIDLSVAQAPQLLKEWLTNLVGSEVQLFAMGRIRYVLAVSSSILGVIVLMFSLLQPDRPTLGIAFGGLLILYGLVRLYIGPAG